VAACDRSPCRPCPPGVCGTICLLCELLCSVLFRAVAWSAEDLEAATLRTACGDGCGVVCGQVEARVCWSVPAWAPPSVGVDPCLHGGGAAGLLPVGVWADGAFASGDVGAMLPGAGRAPVCAAHEGVAWRVEGGAEAGDGGHLCLPRDDGARGSNGAPLAFEPRRSKRAGLFAGPGVGVRCSPLEKCGRPGPFGCRGVVTLMVPMRVCHTFPLVSKPGAPGCRPCSCWGSDRRGVRSGM
jgi:hypothetical protein